MIHRALFGSIERFFAVLLEHYAGAFPPWLAPVQVVGIPIAEAHVATSRTSRRSCGREGIRVEVDTSDDRMQKKIRNAQRQKVPYMLIAGDEDVARRRGVVPLPRRQPEERRAGGRRGGRDRRRGPHRVPGASRVTRDAFDRLWTPHRMAYIQGEDKPDDDEAGDGCPFCRAPGRPDDDGLIVARGEHGLRGAEPVPVQRRAPDACARTGTSPTTPT